MQAAAASLHSSSKLQAGCDDEPACSPNSSGTHSNSSDSSSSSGTNSSSTSSDNSTSYGSSTSSSDSDTSGSSGGTQSRSRSSSRTHRNNGRSRSRDRPKARRRSRHRNDSKTRNRVRSRSRAGSRGYGRSRSRDRHSRQRHSSGHHAAHSMRMRSRSIDRGPSRWANTPRSNSPGYRSLFVGHRVSLELLRRRHQDAGQQWRHTTYDGSSSSRGGRCRSRSPGFSQMDRSRSSGCRQRDRSSSRGGVRDRHGHRSSSRDRGRGQQHRARSSSRSRMSPSRDRQPDHSRDKQGTAGAARTQASLAKGNEGQHAKQQLPGSKAHAARAPSRMPVSIAMQECQREVSSSPDASPRDELQHSMDMPGTTGAGSRRSSLGRQQRQQEASGQLPQLQAQQQEQQQQQQQLSSTVLQPPVPEGRPHRRNRSSSKDRHGNKQAGDMPPLRTSPQLQHAEQQAAAAGGASSRPSPAQPQDDGVARRHSSIQHEQPDSNRDKQGTGWAARAQPSLAEGNSGWRAKQQVPGTIARPARPMSRLPISIAMQECQQEASNSPDARPRNEQQHSLDGRGAAGAGDKGSSLSRQQGQQQASGQVPQLQGQQQEQKQEQQQHQQQQAWQHSNIVLQPLMPEGQTHRRSRSSSRERHGDKQAGDMPPHGTSPQQFEHPAAAAGAAGSRLSPAQPQHDIAQQGSACQQQQQSVQPTVVEWQVAAASRGSSPAHCRDSNHTSKAPPTQPGSRQGPSCDRAAATAPDSVGGSKPAAASSKPFQCRRSSSNGSGSGAHSSSMGKELGVQAADSLSGPAVVSTVSCLQACTGPDSKPPTLQQQDPPSGSSTQEAVEPHDSSSAPVPAGGSLQGAAAAAGVSSVGTLPVAGLPVQQQQTQPSSSSQQEAVQTLDSSSTPLPAANCSLQADAVAAGSPEMGTLPDIELPNLQQQIELHSSTHEAVEPPNSSSSEPLPAAESSLQGSAATAGVSAGDLNTPGSQQQQQQQTPCASVGVASQQINALLCDAEPYRPQALRSRHLAHRQRSTQPAQHDSTVGQQQQVMADEADGQQQQQQVPTPSPANEAVVAQQQQSSLGLAVGEDAAAGQQLQPPAGECPVVGAEPPPPPPAAAVAAAGQVHARQQVESVVQDAAAGESQPAGPAEAVAAEIAGAGHGQTELSTSDQVLDQQQQQEQLQQKQQQQEQPSAQEGAPCRSPQHQQQQEQQQQQQQQARVQEMAPCSSSQLQQHHQQPQQQEQLLLQQQLTVPGPAPAAIFGVSRSLPSRAPAGLVIQINRVPGPRTNPTPTGLVAACATTPADVCVGDTANVDMDLSPTSAPVPAAGAFAAGAQASAAAGAMDVDENKNMSPNDRNSDSGTRPWGSHQQQQQQQQQQLEQRPQLSSGPGDGAVRAAAGGFSALSSHCPTEQIAADICEREADCAGARLELEEAVRQVEYTAQESRILEGQVYWQCDAAGNPLPPALPLKVLVARYPEGVDAEGEAVQVVSEVDGTCAVPLLLAAKNNMVRVYEIKRKWHQQAEAIKERFVKLRQHISNLLLGMCYHDTASIQQTRWLWLNPPSNSKRPDPLSWEQLVTLTSGANPLAVQLVPVSGQTVSGQRTSLAEVQQKLYEVDYKRAAVAGRLPDSSFYVNQLPYFDDNTASWLLWDNITSGRQCSQAVSINMLRVQLVNKRLPLHQLVYHATDPQCRPAWAFELIYLPLLNNMYADRNGQVQARQQQMQMQMQWHLQHRAASVSPQAAAALPVAQQLLSPCAQQQQQQQQHLNSPQGSGRQLPMQQQQPQQEQQLQQVQSPSVLKQQQYQHSPLPAQQQQKLHAAALLRMQQQSNALLQREGSSGAPPAVLQRQQQQQQQKASQGAPGVPSPPAPCTPPNADPGAGTSAAAAASSAAAAAAGASATKAAAPAAAAAAERQLQMQHDSGLSDRPRGSPATLPADPSPSMVLMRLSKLPPTLRARTILSKVNPTLDEACRTWAEVFHKLRRDPKAPPPSPPVPQLDSSLLGCTSQSGESDADYDDAVSDGHSLESDTAAQQLQQDSSAMAPAAAAAVGAGLSAAAVAVAAAAGDTVASDLAAASAVGTSSSSQRQQQQSEPPSSEEADVVVVQQDFTNVHVVMQDASAAAAVQPRAVTQQQQRRPAQQQQEGAQHQSQARSREATPAELLPGGLEELMFLEAFLPEEERSTSPEAQATKPAPVPVPEPGAAAAVSPPGTGDSQLISPGPLPAPALAAGLHKFLTGPQEQPQQQLQQLQQQQQQQQQPVEGRLTVASAIVQHIKQKAAVVREERAEQQEADSGTAAGAATSPGPASKRRKLSAAQQVLGPAASALRSAADLLAPEDRAAVLEAAGLTQRAGRSTRATSASQPNKQQQRVEQEAKKQQQQATKQQKSFHAVISADGKVQQVGPAGKQRQQDSAAAAAAAAANRSEASSSTTNAEAGASTSSRQVEKQPLPPPQQQQQPQSRLSRPQQQASSTVPGKRRRSGGAPDSMPAVSAAAVDMDDVTKQELRNAAFGLRPTKQQLRQRLSGGGTSVAEQAPQAQQLSLQQQQQQRRPPRPTAAGRLSSQLEQSSAAAAAAERSPPPEVQPPVHQQLQAVRARAGSVSRAVSPAAGPLAAAFPSPSPAPPAAVRGSRSRARSSSVPPSSRAASMEPPPPALQGCARGLDVEAARAAAFARKKPGYSRGLYQALQRRERLQDYRTAAAVSGVTTGPYGSRAQLVPYALPACLLRMNRDKAAASSAREGSVASAVSNGGSRAGRATSARNAQVLAEANKRRAAKPGKQLALQRSGVHGYGLFAAERIQAGDFVIEYVGVIIRPVLEDIVEARYEQQGQNSSYLFTIDKQQVADATVRGGLARFINHCCDPNCKPKEFYGPDGVARMGIYALRDIQPGEELHYDYQFEYEFEEDRRLKCYCGAAICPGYMNWQEGLKPEDLQGPARSRAQHALLAAGSGEQQQEQAQ